MNCLLIAGFTITFASRKCVICDLGSIQVAEISCNSISLYKLIKKIDNEEQINSFFKLLTLNQVYYCSGYIALAVAFKLFYDGIVTGL